jgi:hypothetical protein
MKNFGVWLGIWAFLFAVAVLSFKQQGEINALTLRSEFLNSENRLLKDQVNELENLLPRKATYEQGLTDGLIRSATAGYTDGYHAAIQQISQQKEYEATNIIPAVHKSE